jgi:UDP-glucose 4-epimerase
MEKINKNVLITGVSGFIGSYLLKEIIERNINKVAILLRSESDTYRVAKYLKKCKIFYWNGEYSIELSNQIRRFLPDAWVHLAWKGVENDYTNDISQITYNIKQLNASLLLAKESGCKQYIGIGSQAEYGVKHKIITETDSTEPITVYGKAKLASRWISDAFCTANNMKWSWLRIFSTYGPLDNVSWFIPYLIKTFINSEIPDTTLCKQNWDYLYVEDAAKAILSVIDREAIGIYNVASGKALLLKDIAERIKNKINPDLVINYGAKKYTENQIMHLEGNISKINQITGWKPQIEINKGLDKTIEYFLNDEK